MLKAFILTVLLYSTTTSANCPIPNSLQSLEDARSDDLTYRLPRNINPIRYSITLHPDLRPNLNPATFEGSVTIDLQPYEDTNNITLKIRQLTIDENTVVLTNSTGAIIEIAQIEPNSELELFVIHLDENLLRDQNYVLTIGSYSGELNRANAGLYLAIYYDEDGTERRFATTQFESTNARRAFPSFDEPEYKSTFVVKLRRDESYTSISNENIIESVPLGNGVIEDVYEESVKMSTYLMAFIVSQFDYVESGNQKVYARPEAVRDGWANYSLPIGIQTIDALETFLNVPYSLGKLDQVAIPDDYFSPGAMENWGLVTYKESYLLAKPEYTTTREYQRITTVIAHELGHQWFGNLVTLAWWRYLWLNEGFATYFEFYAASEVKTGWRLMEQFVLDVQYALEADSSNSTQPLNYETESGGSGPSYISYEKGGSVIRMAEHFLTTPIFREGLTIYLGNREYDIAVPDDLFEAWQAAAVEGGTTDLLGALNVTAILTPWVEQKGYPIVSVIRNYEEGTVTLSQERFLRSDYPDEDVRVTWPIPINFMYSSRDEFNFSVTTADYWFTTETATIEDAVSTGFLIANKRETGYYRVNYDETNWQNIIAYLNEDDFQKIDPLNRAQLIDDSFNFAKAGVVSYEIPLALSAYLSRETDYLPLSSFFTVLSYLNTIESSSGDYQNFKEHITALLAAAAEELTFEERPNDEHVDKLNRVNVMNWLCDLGDVRCRESALNTLRSWQDSETSSPSPDLQLFALCGALRTGDQDEWNFLYEKYQNEKVDIQRTRILNSLGCSEDEGILTNYLDTLLNPESNFVKNSDRQTGFATVYNRGSVGLNVAFNYVKENYAEINDSLNLNLATIVTGISNRLSNSDQLVEFTELTIQLNEFLPEGTINTALQNVQNNLNWASTYIPAINNWIEEFLPESTTPEEEATEVTVTLPEDGETEVTVTLPEDGETEDTTTDEAPDTTTDEDLDTTTSIVGDSTPEGEDTTPHGDETTPGGDNGNVYKAFTCLVLGSVITMRLL